MDASADQTETQRYGERPVRCPFRRPQSQVQPNKPENQPMSTEAIVAYTPEQDRIQNEVGTT
jgi:hypothetical protein